MQVVEINCNQIGKNKGVALQEMGKYRKKWDVLTVCKLCGCVSGF